MSLTRPIKPMLAAPLDSKFNLAPGRYIAEEKYDGHRVIIERESSGQITAWSRTGKEKRLPSHILSELAKLPNGVYDGELLVFGGKNARSYGVTDLLNTHRLGVVLFDILEVAGHSATHQTLEYRLTLLAEIWKHQDLDDDVLRWAPRVVLTTTDDLESFLEDVWSRDGEGAIVKDLHAPYYVGKRNRAWMKIKALGSAALTVVGFAPSTGQIENRGPFAIAVLYDSESDVYTMVKTLNNAELARLSEECETPQEDWAYSEARVAGRRVEYMTSHPRVGKTLRVEYHERTPDGSYRHARWDRWEEE